MDKNLLQEISERQKKLISEQFAFEKFVESHEKELVDKFKEQFPEVKLYSGKIHVHDCSITINALQYSFLGGKWIKR